MKNDKDKEPTQSHESYCPHCDNWHSGLCRPLYKKEPLEGIDTPYYPNGLKF